MNKKIKIIDLINRVESGKEIPKKIKYNQLEFKYDKGSGKYIRKNSSIITWFCIERFTNDFLNKTVEILEDDTEEIEELPDYNYSIKDNREKINEIIRYIKRKEKSNDK